MDKVELKKADTVALFAWKDEHKDLLYQMPAPLKAVEIDFVETGLRVVGIRNGSQIKITLSAGFNRLGSKDFQIRGDRLIEKKKRSMLVSDEQFMDAVTAYCALMALMTFGGKEAPEDLEPDLTQQASAPKAHSAAGKRKPARKQSRRITYIIRNAKGQLTVAPRGAHAKPTGIFTVHGHWRHYKSGKVVWIAEYKKGTGKKKSKTYRVGLKGEKESRDAEKTVTDHRL